jgi:hypothetical protein
MILTWLKSAALVALIVFLGFGSYLLWVTARVEKDLASQASATISAANAAIAHVNTATDQVGVAFTNAASSLQAVTNGANQTFGELNKPCVPGPCGTLADINKTLGTVRGTFGQIEIAANHEDKNLSTLDTQEATLFTDFDTLAKTGNSDASDLDALLKRKALQNFVDNLGPLSANFVAITGTGEHMLQTGDAVETKATDSYLHPSKNPWVRGWKATYPWLLIGAQGAVKWSPVVP